MPPKTVYIIRHCDKPANSDEEGALHPGACLCSPQGYERANLLADYFSQRVSGTRTLVASAFSPDNPRCSCEQRERLVLVPTSIRFGVPINLPCCFQETDAAARFILAQTGTVVVAWEHHHIPVLARALGVQAHLGAWPDDRFDIVFRLEFGGGANSPELRITTQGLGLSGDSVALPDVYASFQPTPVSVRAGWGLWVVSGVGVAGLLLILHRARRG